MSSKNGTVRGSEKGQLFEVGRIITATDDQRRAAESAAGGVPEIGFNEDGKYIDYFYWIGSFDDLTMMCVEYRG